MKKETCPKCHGEKMLVCSMCKGTGRDSIWEYRRCSFCEGTLKEQCGSCFGKGVKYTCEDADLRWIYDNLGAQEVSEIIADRYHYGMWMAVIAMYIGDNKELAEKWLRIAHRHMPGEGAGCVCGEAEWLGEMANRFGLHDLATWFGRNTYCPKSPQYRYGEPAAGVRSYAEPHKAVTSWTAGAFEVDRARKYFLEWNEGHPYLDLVLLVQSSTEEPLES